MILFRGHPVRVREVAARAVRAAGLPVTWQDIRMEDPDCLDIGFFQTLPIHIRFERLGLTLWRVTGLRHPYPVLHAWSGKYPTWVSLLTSVPGISVLNAEG